MSPPFPILGLPSKALRETLRIMDCVDLIHFSLTSTSADEKVEPRISNSNILTINVYKEMIIVRVGFSNPSNTTMCYSYSTRLKIIWVNTEIGNRWSGLKTNFQRGIGLKQLADRISKTLNLTTCYQLSIYSNTVPFADTCEILDKLQYTKVVLDRTFCPSMVKLANKYSSQSLIVNRFNNTTPYYHHIFNKHRDYLHLREPLSLDDLLAFNARKTCFFVTILPLKTISLFAKHLINGSNQYLHKFESLIEETTATDQQLLSRICKGSWAKSGAGWTTEVPMNNGTKISIFVSNSLLSIIVKRLY